VRHLYNSRAAVWRLSGDLVDGTPTFVWTQITDVVDPILATPGELMCRLDLTYVRPGKDQPMPIVAGRAPDRVGLLMFDSTPNLKAGDQVRMIAGPVTGTFEIRVVPDPAVGYAVTHHMEVQVIETSQALAGVFPGAGVGGP
jgi:hypothetical protein